jgi:cardiolipin synthase (CMP-forming)
MLRNFKLLPNQITLIRFLLVPIIWGMIVNGFYNYIGIGLIICFISDVFDGQLARRLHQTTEFGAKFDSLADNILIPSAVLWLLILKTEIFSDNPILMSLAILSYVSSMIISHLFTRRVNVSQLYLSKLSGLTQYIFGIHAFVSGYYNEALFYITMGVFFLSTLESLVLQFFRIEVNEHLTSILFIWPLFRRLKVNSRHLNFINQIVNIIYGAQPSAIKKMDIIA